MNPYLSLLHAIVARCNLADGIIGPPLIPVVPEEDEPSPDRPGEGNQVSNRIEAAINKMGIVVIVYIEGTTATEDGLDIVEFRVQVVENPVKNRHATGTQRACWSVLFSLRAWLQNWSPEPAGSWAEFLFVGFETISKGEQIIREARFRTMAVLETSP